ncbi:T9SS type B sorting domain-containing protein [Maribacter ulvicola]|uniref:Gliding motility-associated C-terminal domain-containing protein n=1 Tax=Maribacter ulvicola TaxID=228959 RepID=A0A1N6PHC7_9FLAO|nr:T9SS type B sorting domain-containing protein [Maribacter ulvicola]SIQ03775.1 gliding motility-associated C-terminal domain-containing protein [Maribacter ulvicola]
MTEPTNFLDFIKYIFVKRKPYSKCVLFILVCALGVQSVVSQVKNDFDVRYEADIRGELTFIANNIVNRQTPATEGWEWVLRNGWWELEWVTTPSISPNVPYNDIGNSSTSNDSFDMNYIDIDGDTSTFSSSSATLTIPNIECALVRYAGLYWSAVYTNADRSNIDDIKFKLPGGAYQDITNAEEIYDGFGDSDFGYYSPYVYYKDVTSMVAALPNPNGEYVVANVRADTGNAIQGGVSGGWKMVVVYEDPNLPGDKFITTFDGYAGIASGERVDIPVNGFTTLPAPFPVQANMGVAALEGDNGILRDALQINANGTFSTLDNDRGELNNFFNSSITINDAQFTDRVPNSVNTLGWDVDYFRIDNGGTSNTVIPNGATSATLRASSGQDKYDIFFASFDVDIIAPNIVLKKVVRRHGSDRNDDSGIITGQGVNLGQIIDYELNFENIGNDDGTGYTIKDILPVNVGPQGNRSFFNASDFSFPAPICEGIPRTCHEITYTYDPATREIIFNVPDVFVNQDDGDYSIFFTVQVAEDCFDFIDACSDKIENLAYGTYSGVQNTAVVTEDPSVSDFTACGFTVPGATNFLLDDLAACNFERTTELCGLDTELNAGKGFDSYVWYRDTDNNGELDIAIDIEIHDGDPDNDPSTLTVSEVGTYIVDKIVADPCKGFKEIITVVPFGSGSSPNPITEYFNEVNSDTDPNNDIPGEIAHCVDGTELPKIFLCGINDSQPLTVNIVDAQSVSWELLDEGSCGENAEPGEDCANRALTCTWSEVGTGSNYTLSAPGEYRLSVIYNNGCISRFYFKGYQNTVDFGAPTKRDILCNTNGNITIPAGNGYAFQLVETLTNNILIPFSANNGASFDFAPGEGGSYRIEYTPVDTNGDPIIDACVYSTEAISIRERTISYEVNVTPETCFNLGTVNLQISNADPSYAFELRRNDGTNSGLGTLVDSQNGHGDNNYTFTDVSAGNYIAYFSTDDGCTYNEEVTVLDENDLELTASVTQHITCEDGVILMDATGGNPDYTYAIWSYVDEGGNTVISYPDFADIPATNFRSNNTFNISGAGDYTFLVLDDRGCYVESNTVTIEYHPTADFDPITVVDVLCFGEASGRIQYNIANANGYALSFALFDDTDQPLADNSTGNFPNLAIGNYRVEITQTIGTAVCISEETFTIDAPTAAISGDAILVQDYTCLQEGIIEAQNVVGGTAPFAYSIDGINFIPDTTANANRFENLTDGSYTITIRDANNCTFATNQIIIDRPNPPTDLTITASQITCPTGTSNLTVNAINGTAPYTYSIIAPSAIAPTGTTGNEAAFNDLIPDTYTVRVTDTDGCFYDENYTINAINPISASGQTTQPISCFGAADGVIRFNVNFQVGQNFTYSITGPSGVERTGSTVALIDNIDNLAAGIYTIAIVDTDTNCTYTATHEVEGPASAMTISNLTEIQPTCIINEGSVSVLATGGWGSYIYALNNPDNSVFGSNSTGSFTGLTQSGTYNGTITDANNCSIPFTFNIDSAEPPILEITPNQYCFDDAVLLTLTASVSSGGDGSYEYSLNGGTFSSSNVFSDLSAGTYTIDVRDGNNCIDTDSITIDPALTVSASASNITACGTDTDINISAAGGDGNYVYAVVADGATPNVGDFDPNTTVSITGTGVYDVYVRDNNGTTDFCESSYEITIDQDDPLALSISNTDILCSGENQAILTIVASGGEAPFKYSINNGTSYQSQNIFNNLGAGTYNILVRDVNNCEVGQAYTISEPFTLSASAAVTHLIECNPTDGAEVRITNAQGGTAPYTYSFDGGSTYDTSAIGYLLAGSHTVYIQDANNCTYPMDVTIMQAPTPPNVVLTPEVDYSCDGTGIVTIATDNPSLDYTYSLNGTANSPVNSNVFTNVPVGTHTITIDYISSIPPAKSELLREDFGVGPNVSIPQIDTAYYCYESQDASFGTCSDTNFYINDLEYSVTSSIVAPFGSWVSPVDNSGNPNGRYLAVNVGNPGVNTIVYSKTNIEIIPNRDVEVDLDVINLVRQGSGLIRPNILVEIVDSSGNVIDSGTTGLIDENTGVNDWRNISIPPLDPGTNSTIDIVIRTIATGTSGNDVAIDNIKAFQSPEQCSQTVSLDVTVEAGNAFEAALISSKDLDCNGDNSGSITFEVDNYGASGFEYSLDNFASVLGSTTVSPQTISGLSAGSYRVYVRDAASALPGCTTFFDHTINEPTPVVVSASLTQEYTCNNGGAEITASANGGTPGYEYQLEDNGGAIITAYQTGTIFSGLTAGTYNVRARDTNGCSDLRDTPIVITAPETPAFTLQETTCYSGNNDASIVVDVTAGNGDYQFRINSGPWLTPTPSNAITYTFANLANGTYTIDVKDGYGCNSAQQSITIEPQLQALIDVVDLSNCADGSITVTATGGDGNYEYAFVPATNDPTGLFGLSNSYVVTPGNEGIYDVYVRDNGAVTPFCEYIETVEVDPALALTYTITATNPDCHDGFGIIEVNVTSGDNPFTIEIIDLDNGGASNQTLTNVVTSTTIFYNLSPGNYTINVRDVDGCLVSDSPINIANPDELTADTEPVLPSGCDPDPNQYGFKFIDYPATLGPLEFSANGGLTWQLGDAFVGVSYASGTEIDPAIRVVGTNCRIDLPRLTIPYPLDDLNIELTANLISCSDLEVTVQGTEGLAPYQYTYSDDPANFDPSTAVWTAQTPGNHVYSGLIPGRTYVFYVRDSSPCLRQSSVNVNDIVPPPVQIDALVTPTCDGLNNGQITYTVTENTLGELGGSFDWDFYRLEPSLPPTLVDSGTITSFTSGDSFVVPTPANLPVGDYFVEIRGSVPNNCIIGGENIRVRELDPITYIPAVIRDITCANDGVIQIQNIQGGGGTYTYTLSSSNFSANIVTTLSSIDVPMSNVIDVTATPFNVNIDVTDQYGCTVVTQTVSMTISQSPSIDSISISNCATPLSLTVNASGGTGSYLYSIDGGSNYLDNGGIFNNIVPDSYDVSIIDGNGCTDTDTVDVHPVLEADVSLTKLLDCSILPDAQITIDVNFGSGNYDYEISNGLGTVVTRTNLPSNPYIYNTLVPEDYVITIYDNDTSLPECKREFTITVPPAVRPVIAIDAYVDATCNDADDGTITVSAIDNGISPFTFEIISGPGSSATFPIAATSSTATRATFNGLEGAVTTGITYTIRATAANGCFEDITQIISEPDTINTINVSVIEFMCAIGNNDNNASITIDDTLINGGSGNYVRYEFIEEDDPNTVTVEAPVVVQSGSNLVYTETDSAGGVYTINVYDDKGCVGSTTATILPFDEITDAVANVTNTVTCNPISDGELTVVVTSTLSDATKFEYSIDNGVNYQTSNIFGGLSVGSYTILVKHLDTGCIVSATQTLVEPNTFTINVVKTSDVICYGTATGAVNFALVDATYPGGFTWTIYDTEGTLANTGDDTIVISGTEATTNGPTADISLEAGSYYVSIRQDNNPFCTNTEAFTINGPTADISGDTVVTEITCNPGDDGSITIIDVVGGWGGYTYYVGVGVPATVDFVAGATFDSLTAGTYQAWARDAEGCEKLIQDNIVLDVPDPIAAILEVNIENCTNLQGEIEVSMPTGGQGSNYTYQLRLNGTDFRAPQNTRVFTGLGAGSYDVSIIDQWGCPFITNAVVLYEQMNISTTVDKPIDCTVTPGGEITVNVNGGSTNLEFEMTTPSGSVLTQTTGVFTNLIEAGTYTFEVRDLDTTNPVCRRETTQTLDAPVAPVLLDATIINVSCFGGTNGSIRANIDPATADNPIYQYELYDIADLVNPIVPAQDAPLFTGLAAGEYQIRVISSRGCDGVKNETITEPTALTITATASEFSCAADNSVNTATITATAGAGTPPYLYSIDNSIFQASNTFNVTDTGTVQTIDVYVKDANGCTTPTTATIQPINTFTATVAQDVAISCTNDETITITVVDNGLAHNYGYELLPIGNAAATFVSDTPTSATYNLNTVGSYVFRVTDLDTGCYVNTASYTVAPFDFITATATPVSEVTCFGDANGSLEIDIDGYTGNYTYEVFNIAGISVIPATASNTSINPRVISGLSGGNYYVTITETDVPFCSEDTNSVTIISPDIALSAVVTPLAEVTCTDDQGVIRVAVEGGYKPYDLVVTNTTTGDEYTMDDVNEGIFTDLAAGDYTVSITDDAGCIVHYTETLSPAAPIVANATPLVTDLACYGDTGAVVTANVTGGGSGTYSYQLNYYDETGTTITTTTGVQTNPNFNDLGAGFYSITVVDGWNCDTTTNTVEVREPTEVQASLIRTDALTCVDGAEFELTATGGSGTYEYSVDSINFLPMTGNVVYLPETGTYLAGRYQFYVRDAINGCESAISNAITESEIPPLELTVDTTAAVLNCTGESTAIIYATADGGLGNYQYELFTDSSLSVTSRIAGPQPQGVFRDLGAGIYYVTVISDDCTTAPEEVIIIEPTPLSYTESVIDITCAGENNGEITVTLSGGAGGYQYAISPNLNQFYDENTFTELAPGDYTIIAQDQNGCFEYLTYTISEPANLAVTAETTPEICVDSQDGTIILDITGGTAPYSTALNSNDDADFVLNRREFLNMAAGNYLIMIKDANGCETNIVVDIETGVNLNATVVPVYECSTDTPDNFVNITLDDDTVIGDVLYAIDSVDPSDLQLNPDFRNTAPGNHYITIVHSNGCLQTVDFVIEDFQPLTLALEQNNMNEITAIVAGGRKDYTYYFDGIDNGDDNTFYISRTDTYEVRVVDENGCSTIANIFMEFIDIEVPDFFTPDGDGKNDLWIPRNIEQYPEILIKIFDRYGRVVSEQSVDSEGWDGTYLDNELPTGDYWYVVKLNGDRDEREFVGHFTLYR